MDASRAEASPKRPRCIFSQHRGANRGSRRLTMLARCLSSDMPNAYCPTLPTSPCGVRSGFLLQLWSLSPQALALLSPSWPTPPGPPRLPFAFPAATEVPLMTSPADAQELRSRSCPPDHLASCAEAPALAGATPPGGCPAITSAHVARGTPRPALAPQLDDLSPNERETHGSHFPEITCNLTNE